LGGALYLQREIPLRRLARIEALLEAGDYAAARPLTERVNDEALAEGFRARCDYLEGVQRMENGEWAEARELLANAGSYADAAERVQTCSYALAEALLADGEYDAAAEAFASLGGYGDAADRALGCRYEKALALEEDGDAAGAAEIVMVHRPAVSVPAGIVKVPLPPSGTETSLFRAISTFFPVS
jgi:hypothetical protein